jgi:hypothetical protein
MHVIIFLVFLFYCYLHNSFQSRKQWHAHHHLFAFFSLLFSRVLPTKKLMTMRIVIFLVFFLLNFCPHNSFQPRRWRCSLLVLMVPSQLFSTRKTTSHTLSSSYSSSCSTAIFTTPLSQEDNDAHIIIFLVFFLLNRCLHSSFQPRRQWCVCHHLPNILALLLPSQLF